MKISFIILFLFWTLMAAAQIVRPIAEYEKMKYLILSAELDYQTHHIKMKMIEELPEDMEALVYSTDQRILTEFQQQASRFASASRVKYLRVNVGGESFWAQDSFPKAVLLSNQRVGLVDAVYPKYFEPDQIIAKHFKAQLFKHKTPFEHGNLMSNTRGECIIVNYLIEEKMNDSVFIQNYGCKKLIRLPYKIGIGHVDEVAKFMNDDTVITQDDESAEVLKKAGFQVVRIPDVTAKGAFGFNFKNYLNSVFLNGKVLVPQFGLDTDAEAVRVYESLGFKAIPIQSGYVADIGGGGLHCLSMTYPEFK